MKAAKMLIACVLITVMAACGNGKSENTSGENAPSTPSPSASATPEPASGASDGEKTIEHAMGSVTLAKPPERVVILFNGMVDNAAALGVKPVGAVESWEEKPWYQFLRDKMDGVTDLGEETQPNLEKIVELKPDLIIASKTRHEKLYDQLSAIAPTIMMDTLFDWKANLRLGAAALYKEDEADRIIREWDDKVARFKEKVGDSLSATEISLMRFESDGSARFYVTGFAGTIFQELGLARPKAQQLEDQTVVNLTSKEQMEQLDGDYIFDMTRFAEGDDSNRQTKEAWTTHPLWSKLKGVRAGHYYPVDVITWNLSAGALAANSLLDDLYTYFDIQ